MSMSVSSSAANLSQMMAAFLARIKASEQASQTASTATAGNTSTTAVSDPTAADGCNAAASAGEPTLSDQVIGTLVAMQMQSGDASATDATSTSGSDPIAQAFSALDTDANGAISQSELETGIANEGGTSDEADAIFSALGGTSTNGISETSFASAAQAGAPLSPDGTGGPGGPNGAHGHHHHHHSSDSSSASDDASQIFSAIDSNDDGSISSDELASALGLGTTSDTSNGAASAGTTGTGTTSDGSTAATQFAAIDANGDGSISQDELKTYLGNLQQTAASDQATINSFLQLANQSYSQSLSLMDPSSIGASSTV